MTFASRQHSNRGFTLIEVIVAIVIIAFALLSAIQLTTSHINTVVEVEKRTLATWVASNHMADLRYEALTERLKSGSNTERYTMGGQRWRSRARVEETEIEKVFLVTIEVRSDNGQDTNNYAQLTSAIKAQE